MKRPAVTEQQVAEVVVAYLEAMGADVYQEVTIAGGVADIVAKVRAEVWIVEVKTSLSLALLTQAMERRRLAHRVYIAAPYTRHVREVAEMCSELGIGLLEVRTGDFGGHWEYEQPRVTERVEGRRWNSRPLKLSARLDPEHKTHAKAGAPGAAGRWTPFRRTCERLAGIVHMNAGCTLKEAIDKLEHHYSSDRGARTSLAHWIASGKVPGVRIERGDALRLFPVERPPP